MHIDDNKRLTGAMIERGRIAAAGNDGYTVVSLDRDGITSPPIRAIGDGEYAQNDTVYFFLFSDGTGAIIAPVQ